MADDKNCFFRSLIPLLEGDGSHTVLPKRTIEYIFMSV